MTSVIERGADQRVITPTVRKTALRWLFWVGAVVFALLVGLVTVSLAGGGQQGEPLSPTNPAPGGTMALAEVLRQQGVEVAVTESLDETRAAITSPASTTLVIHDLQLILDDDQLADAVSLADRVILVDPTFGELQAVAPGVAQAGYLDDGPVGADCSVDAVQRAGEVSVGGSGYRITDEELDALGCLGSADDVYSVIEIDGGRLTLLGATDAITNEKIVNYGNAAFALGLLGQEASLVWYVPTFLDIADVSEDTLGTLTPAWVTPVLALLTITVIVAATWRGRRFGPLVIENLPVTVRASETMLGRARLYERSSSPLRALDALRVGSVQRLATSCGLPTTATVDDVIASCAAVTGRQVADIRGLLIGREPATDRDLMVLSDDLLILERDVGRAVRP